MKKDKGSRDRTAIDTGSTYLVEPSIAMSRIYRTAERIQDERRLIKKIEMETGDFI